MTATTSHFNPHSPCSPSHTSEHGRDVPPVFQVRGLEAHARVIGAGHRCTTLELQLDAGQVMHFALADLHLVDAAQKLVALCRARGLEVDLNYRPLIVQAHANGQDHGHTKALPVLPVREKVSPPVLANDHSRLGLLPEAVEQAWTAYSTGRTRMEDQAFALGVSKSALRSLLADTYGERFAVASRLWLLHAAKSPADRERVITERMDHHFPPVASAVGEAAPIRKPNGSLL